MRLRETLQGNSLRDAILIAAAVFAIPILGTTENPVATIWQFLFLLVGFFYIRTGGSLALQSDNDKLPLLGWSIICLASLVHLVPFPVLWLSYLNPASAEYYRLAGLEWGFIGLSSYHSLLALTWFISLSVFVFLVYQANPELESSVGDARARSLLFESTDRFSELIRILIVCAGFFCSIGAIFLMSDTHYAQSDYLVTGSQLRISWPFANPNHLALFLNISFAVYVHCVVSFYNEIWQGDVAYENKGFKELLMDYFRRGTGPFRDSLLFFVGLILITALAFTRSRTGLVVLITTFCLIGVFVFKRFLSFRSNGFQQNKLYSRLTVIVVVALTVLGCLSVLFSGVGVDFIFGRFQAEHQRSLGERLHLLELTFLVVRDNPIFGVGVGSWHAAVQPYASDLVSNFTLDYAHNDAFQFLSEMGAFGLLGAILITICILRSSLVTLLTNPYARLEILSTLWPVLIFFAHSCTDFPFHIPGLAILFCLCLSLLLRALRTYRNT